MSSPTRWFWRLGCFLGLLGLATLQLFIALQEQTEYSGTGSSAATLEYLRSPYLLTWHAKRLQLIEGETTRAEEMFKRALVNNPVFIPAWLGLAELDNDQGRKAESQAILDYVDQLSTDIQRWRWEKALLAYQLGRIDILSRDLSYIIEKIPGKSRQSALKLAFAIWDDPWELLDKVGEQNILHLFNYANQTKEIETTLKFWPHIEKMGVAANKNATFAFLDGLIGHGEMAMATKIWKKYFNTNLLLHDGSFQEEPLNTAFGWRVGKPKGSNWRIEQSTGKDRFQAIRLHFSGTENIAYSHLSQIVPLEPARKYQLTGRLKTAKLTTDQRPYLEVVGYKCTIPQARSEMMDETRAWTSFTLSFSVSEDCRAVLLRLRRDPSKRLDNLLAGDLWLRDLEIHDTGENFSVLDTIP